jgi:hypothetical protein
MCTISINQPTAIVSSGTITSITVTGSTTNCRCGSPPLPALTVSIKCCDSASAVSKSVPVTVNGTVGSFTVIFSGNDLIGCKCDGCEILVTVMCLDAVQTKTFKIICEQDCCLDFVLSTIIGACVNGKRQVDFDISFNITDERCLPYQFYLEYGDNSTNSATQIFSSFGNNQHFIESHSYNPGNYTAILHYITHPNCPPLSIPLTIRPCEPNCCPNAIAVITSEIKEECNKDGETKNVKIDAVITPIPQPGCPTNIQAEMWIDNSLVATGSGSSPFTLSHQADYKCLDHNVVIKYPGSNCPDSGGSFCVSVCETRKCKKRRFSFEVASTVALISLLLYLFNSAYTLLAGLSTVFLVVAIINYIRWRPCDQICKKCPRILAVWQIALATFLGFIMLSKSSFIIIYGWLVAAFAFAGTFAPILAIIVIIIIILLIILIIYLLYRRWVANCCPTECEKWTYIKESLLDVCAISFAIIGGFILSFYGAGVAGLFWLPYATVGWALIIWWVKLKKIDACGF